MKNEKKNENRQDVGGKHSITLLLNVNIGNLAMKIIILVFSFYFWFNYFAPLLVVTVCEKTAHAERHVYQQTKER